MEQNFTQKSMSAISEAHNFAIRYKHSEIKTEHLLLALINQMDGLIPNILQKMGINPAELTKKLEAKLNTMLKRWGTATLVQSIYFLRHLITTLS